MKLQFILFTIMILVLYSCDKINEPEQYVLSEEDFIGKWIPNESESRSYLLVDKINSKIEVVTLRTSNSKELQSEIRRSGVVDMKLIFETYRKTTFTDFTIETYGDYTCNLLSKDTLRIVGSLDYVSSDGEHDKYIGPSESLWVRD